MRSVLQFYYKDIEADEIQLTESERKERTKKLVMMRKKKMRESRPSSNIADGGSEAAIHIRGAGLQTPSCPGDMSQEPSDTDPAEQAAKDASMGVDRTVSAALLTSLLSNPKLTDAQRQILAEMQADRTGRLASSDDTELQQWLTRTPSRQNLARNRRELEILQTLESELTGAQLVRSPSASSQADATDEVRRLEEVGTQAEMTRVAAEVAKLKEELGLL